MTVFALLNWFLCLITTIFLALIIWRQRFLLVKPSIIVIIFFHLMIQWAATVTAPDIEHYLPNPWHFMLLTQGFPLIGLAVSIWIGRRNAAIIWQRVRNPQTVLPRIRRKAILFLSMYIVLFALIYLRTVPLSSTGLYAIFLNPADANLAREYSLKLQESALIRYGYGFMATVFVPLLSVLLTDTLTRDFKRKRFLRVIIVIIALGSILVVVSLSGARSFAATVIMTFIYARLLHRGLPLNPLYIVLSALVVLALPVMFSLLREGRTPTPGLFVEYLSGGIFRRTFYIPMQTGLWFTHYAQTSGLVGIAAIPRLANLWGIPSIDMPNHIGLLYYSSRIQSVSANTCYVFAFYSYFGLSSFVFSLLALWVLDSIVWFYRLIGDNLLLACVAVISVASIRFTASDYTVVMLSHGFGFLFIVTLVLSYVTRSRVLFYSFKIGSFRSRQQVS